MRKTRENVISVICRSSKSQSSGARKQGSEDILLIPRRLNDLGEHGERGRAVARALILLVDGSVCAFPRISAGKTGRTGARTLDARIRGCERSNEEQLRKA